MAMREDWTVTELAGLTGISKSYISRMAKRGKLKARKRGQTWLIKDADAQTWLATRRKRDSGKRVGVGKNS